jgi:hypothetical protein
MYEYTTKFPWVGKPQDLSTATGLWVRTDPFRTGTRDFSLLQTDQFQLPIQWILRLLSLGGGRVGECLEHGA